MVFIETNFLSQMVTKPTRGNSVLDLVLTNCTQNILDSDTENTKLSDHMIVTCLLGYNPTSPNQPTRPAHDPFSFRARNYHKADLESLNRDLGEVDWHLLKELCDEDVDWDGTKFKDLIVLTVLQLTIIHSPMKAPETATKKSKIDRELASLKMKKRKINSKIRELRILNPLSRNLAKLEQNSSLIAYEIKEVIDNNLHQKELAAVSTVKSNPKFFVVKNCTAIRTHS